ncbi:MAG: DNA repair protein RecO [Woeseiaceae bacterium]|nr:DNA repair protein RecO [Woeseiaceae bacterium]MDG1015259.1 DNA repair protein RecO [Woeseiaceae bacterium]MDG1713828.1 DNA repair protein RecO [Woeseiaceae bacterium]MDG1866114.1 DNA repair protein RecO [Woeseiaceae bacterium]
MSKKRILSHPAWILHHRPFSNSSMIFDIITADFGRISLLAKGSRSAKSRFRGILRPFMPLSISWLSRSSLGTLIDAEMKDLPLSLSGDALISGYYINELLLKLLHKDDAQSEIFHLYSETIRGLINIQDLSITLRQFEIKLLELLGYALSLNEDSRTRLPIDPIKYYIYNPEMGPNIVDKKKGPMIFQGSELIAINKQEFTCKNTLKCANRLLRNVISHQLGNKKLMTRKVIEELRRR